MLSVEPLKSAEDATNYYLGVVNYYENDSKSIRWLGTGAKVLGLHGKLVEKEMMLALLKGEMPDGTQLGRIDKDGIHHRPGFDMTLSAPKSFSILLESGIDPRLAEIFDEAVEWFVEEMEKEFAEARQVVNGKVEYIDTKNFVIAAFRQPNSRANQPNTHTHLVVQNMTQCPDGKWRSLASDMDGSRGVIEQIMKHHIYGGLKFRNKLANLVKGINYEIETDGDGLWELKGFPEEVLTHFSERRQDIKADLKENGWVGAKAASLSAKRTRQDKEEIKDFAAWQQDIIKDCHKLNFYPEKIVEATKNPQSLGLFQAIKEKVVELYYGKGSIEQHYAIKAVDVAIESLSQQQAVFSMRDLKKDALKHAIAMKGIVTEDSIDKIIEDNIEKQNLYKAIHPYTGKPLLTTPWQLTLESETIALIEQEKGSISSVCSKEKVTAFIKGKEENLEFSLSPSQKKAIRHFLTTTDRYIAIQGYAGTGKTTMLKLTGELAEQHGFKLRGVTAGSAAAHELRQKGRINAVTFARELGRLQSQNEDLSKMIFVVDEASMLSNPQGHKIMKLIKEHNTQLKVIGDKAQLPSPSSGKWFSLTQDYGIDTVAMTDNLRQRDPQLKESAIHASLGEIYDSIEKLTQVVVKESYGERISYLAEKWLNLSVDERKNYLCFAPTHKDRKEISLLIREQLTKEGQLTGEEVEQPILKEQNLTAIKIRNSIYYAKNNVIRFNIPIPRFGIKAGDYLTVGTLTPSNKEKNTLSLVRENGSQITFNLAYLPKFKTENKDLERPIEVYRKENLNLMVGDRIQFKRNAEQIGVRNSDLAVIEEITNDAIKLTTDEKNIVSLKRGSKELQHLDHGYALTTYAVQGKDKKHGLGLIESSNRFAATIQNYYVETTRGIESMTIVTDNKEGLVKAITTNESDKYSALEMVTSDTLRMHQERFKENKHSLNLQNVIEKKLTKEHEWKALEQVVDNFAKAKEGNDERLASKLAFQIVNDKKLYRLSLTRLKFKPHTYRKNAHALETAKLFKRLSLEERTLFSTVRSYVSLNQEIAKRIHHDKQFKELSVKNIEKTTASLAQKNYNQPALHQLTVKRNDLALLISKDLERFKPYLKHYSIGSLNRIGLPQHDYGQQTKKAESRLESLATHAAIGEIRKLVFSYKTSEGVEREQIASQIKRDAKLAHRFVIDYAKTINQEPDLLWKSIHMDAQAQRDKLYRKGLNGEGRLAFDKLKEYKRIQQDIGLNLSRHLSHDKEKLDFSAIDRETRELFTARNELAHILVENKAVKEVAPYFKLDLNTLVDKSNKHQCRENIIQFSKSQGNFKQRLALGKAIKADMASHYPFIKELKLDTKVLNKYIRVGERQERLNTLDNPEKKDYILLLNYKKLSIQAYKAWQEVHKDKKSFNKEAIFHASNYSSKRDYLAYQLSKSPYLDSLLEQEKIKKEKVFSHQETHALKVQEIASINNTMSSLSAQFDAVKTSSSSKRISTWKDNWAVLNKQLERIEKGNKYQFALNQQTLNLSSVHSINKELNDFEIPKAKINNTRELKTAPKELKMLLKTSRYIDAKEINEVLMANPEQAYSTIFGEPKSKNASEFRYSGGLIVTLKGHDKGLWYDFIKGIGGSPIQAIMEQENISFKEAIKVASSIAGLDRNFLHELKNTTEKKVNLISKEVENKNKILSANSIWNGSKPIQGTLAEKYLNNHRGIKDIMLSNARFWPKGAPWKNCNKLGLMEDKINGIPALVFAATNEKGDITGVQRIYLDEKTANKNTFLSKAKLSKGIIEGSSLVIQKGMRGSRLYVAEGPETGASVAMADSKATVLVSLGVSNMKNLAGIIKSFHPKEVVIAKDNDGDSAKSNPSIEETINLYKEHNLSTKIVCPDMLSGKSKTDWNDILINKGLRAIQQKLSHHDVHHIDNKVRNSIKFPETINKNLGIKSEVFINNFSKNSYVYKEFYKQSELKNLVSNYINNNSVSSKTNQLSQELSQEKIKKDIELDL